MPQAISTRPWHLLPVALLLLLWHGALALDYLNDRFALASDMPYLMESLPLDALWLKVAWAMTVWLGLLGAVFLLWGDDASVLLIFAAAVAMLAVLTGIVLSGAPVDLAGLPAERGWQIVAPALVLVPLLGWLYARWQKRRRVLH
ncbi:MAG: hypothetical protein JJU15_07345 [Pararhodobacter sp.]|nr:hypothetical protein [Pararhodobacter sp.]